MCWMRCLVSIVVMGALTSFGTKSIGSAFESLSNLDWSMMICQLWGFYGHGYMVWMLKCGVLGEGGIVWLSSSRGSPKSWIDGKRNHVQFLLQMSEKVEFVKNSTNVGCWMLVSRRTEWNLLCCSPSRYECLGPVFATLMVLLQKLFATENKSMIPMISSVWVETSREQNIGKDNPPVKIEIFSFFVP